MNKITGWLIVLVIVVLGGGIAYIKTHPHTIMFRTLQTKTYGTHGVTFEVPSSLTVLNVPSTDGNYQNYQINSSATQNTSIIMVSIPLKNGSSPSTLADIVKPFTDPAGIKPMTTNGRTGQAITYAYTTGFGDVPWTGTVTWELYPSNYSTSPIMLEYQAGSGDDSLSGVWASIKNSIIW